MIAVIFMLRRFFYGRYGSDQLNLAMLIGMAVLSALNCILYILLGSSLLYALLSVVVDTLLVLSVFRMFSRNIPRIVRHSAPIRQTGHFFFFPFRLG